MALRRRLDGVADIRISQERQTADVHFAPGPHVFAASEFRAAVGEAEVEVLRFEIEACGHMERESDVTWFTAGLNRFLLAPSRSTTPGESCLTADLDDAATPGRLERVRITPAGRGVSTR